MENHLQKKTLVVVNLTNSRQEFGHLGEDIACNYLKKNGYKILARRYRYRRSEIDIIAQKGRTLVFVEVKTRRHKEFGYPEEAIKKPKKNKLRDAAAGFLSQQKEKFSDFRFDILSIIFKSESNFEIVHFEDAF